MSPAPRPRSTPASGGPSARSRRASPLERQRRHDVEPYGEIRSRQKARTPLTSCVRRLPRHEVAAVAEQERADVVGKDDRGHAVEVRVEHVVARAEQDQDLDVVRSRAIIGSSLRGGLVEHALVAAEARPQLRGVGERLGVEVDGAPPNRRRGDVAEDRRVRPEARRVERRDVAAALVRACRVRRRARRRSVPWRTK